MTETQRKRSLQQRMFVVYGILLVFGLIIVSRLIELQIIGGEKYHELAQAQHFGGVVLPAKRGEILSRNSKNGELSIFATNTTLDMVYIDPLITEDPTYVAETMSDTLVTDDFHSHCLSASDGCPLELIKYYPIAFDPLENLAYLSTGTLLEPVPDELPRKLKEEEEVSVIEVRRKFARDIEDRISEKRVTFVPLLYGANKVQIEQVRDFGIRGISVSESSRMVFANPEEVDQGKVSGIARKLAEPLDTDPAVLQRTLRSRPLRYVPVMRKLPPLLSSAIRELQQQSLRETQERRKHAPTNEAAQEIHDPLWSVALVPQHWRFYPDDTVSSHVVGFLNTNQEAQYGIERTFDPQLRGQEGLIRSVNDPTGGQILTAEQRIIDPKDGDTIVLTIDRYVQREVETILDEAVREYDADSAQAIVMDPQTGRIIAMANAPLFDSNNYGAVYERAPIYLDDKKQKEIVVELYHPESREFILKAYWGDVFTEEGYQSLSTKKQEDITALQTYYDLENIVRYYMYIGENSRREIFPTERKDIWLKYGNNIGVGAYINRNIQEIYEPGSVLKPITMAIALDQGEVAPSDTYLDDEPVEVDEYTIRNAFNRHFGESTMTQCLEFSINTCMTFVSGKLGRKLFHRMLYAFGFGAITGIELEDELPGEIRPWRKWSNALLATAAYGQGITATPLQVITGYSALANGGKLMRPSIVDSILRSDGTVEHTKPHIVDQVITAETADTISAMLVSSTNNGYAKSGKVPGYRMAGKTGTSQIAGPGGKYETGTGSSITSFVGYAPPRDTKFVVLVKFDRPRGLEYGSITAAPTFKKIATFLLKYYGIPPDDF
jgi:cell division protein FtsI/penicillin-binding protein 2